LVEINHPDLSVRRQCELLGLNRSTLFYEPTGATPEDLRLMRLIDEQYTACPFYFYCNRSLLPLGLCPVILKPARG
jgi:putative transposase